MKVIVAGSRTVTDYALVKRVILESGFTVSEIVSGGAKGVDTLGELYASEHGIPVKVFKADWSKYGKAAGFIRNAEMGEYADALVAIRKDNSKGTTHMITFMKKQGKRLYVLDL